MYLKSSNLKRKIKFNKNYFVYKRNHFGFQCFLCSLFLWISFEWLHFNNSNNRKEDNGRSNIALLPVWMWLKSKSSTHRRYINIIKKAFDSQSVSWPYNLHITARETFACKKKPKKICIENALIQRKIVSISSWWANKSKSYFVCRSHFVETDYSRNRFTWTVTTIHVTEPCFIIDSELWNRHINIWLSCNTVQCFFHREFWMSRRISHVRFFRIYLMKCCHSAIINFSLKSPRFSSPIRS